LDQSRTAAEDLLDWMLARMDDLIATYPTITVRELVEAVHHCAVEENKVMVDRFNNVEDK
jgi:hypothetical protein